MPDDKLDARQSMINAGLIKPAKESPPPAPQQEPKAGDPPPVLQPPKFDFSTPDNTGKGAEPPPAPDVTETGLPEGAKKAVRQMREHIKTLEGQLRQAKGKSPGEEEVKALREQLEQAHDMIAELDLTRDPRFIAMYENPRSTVLSNMEAVLEEFGADKSIVKDLVGKDFKAQAAILKENIPDGMGALVPLVQELNRLDADRNSKLAMKREAKEAIIRQSTEQERAILDQSFSIAFQAAAEQGDILYKEIPGNDKFNENVSKLKQYARQLGADNTTLGRARLAQMAAGGQVYRDLFMAEQARASALEKELSALGRSLPRSTGGTPAAADASRKTGRMTAEEAARMVSARL